MTHTLTPTQAAELLAEHSGFAAQAIVVSTLTADAAFRAAMNKTGPLTAKFDAELRERLRAARNVLMPMRREV